jgi:hypothetical protein
MALIKCGECGREISSAAPACPGCGRPQQKKRYRGWKPVIVVSFVTALAAFLYKSKSTPSAADAPLEMRVTAPSPVCRDESLYRNVIGLIVEKDRGGAEKILNRAVANHQCQILEAGQQVEIEKGSSLPCVRWSDEPECWYISPTLMEVIP